MDQDLEERLIGLETYAANQETVIQDLSDVIAEQWKLIEKLERNVNRLSERIQGLEAARPGEDDRPPPHY